MNHLMIDQVVDLIVRDKIVVIMDDVSCFFLREQNLACFFLSANMGGGSRDNQQGNDYGFGYPRTRDDRGGGGGGGGGGGRDREYNRQGQGQGQRNRYQDDDNHRPSSGVDRPRYAGRYSDTR